MSLITNTDSTILPYNDDYMVYDLDRSMYLLTDKGVRYLIGEELIELAGNSIKAELIRYEVSQDIYNYISANSLIGTYDYKVWLMAKDEELRPIIQRILADQMRYYIRSGAGLLKDMHGVQVEKTRALSLDSLRGKVLISYSAEQLLLQSGLLYTGRMYYSDYSEDGTW
jgi:hypothetical protein